MLQPQPHRESPQTTTDRRRIEDLRRLLNRSEGDVRRVTQERDLCRWQFVLLRNKLARLEMENESMRQELKALAGEVEELRARLAIVKQG